jgi:glutaredoxin
MARSTPAALLLLAAMLACDRPPSSGATADARPAQPELAAERPEGWQSLEDEASATRLYYQFVDERGRVRFVERLEDVPEHSRAGVGFVKLDVPPPLTPGFAASPSSPAVMLYSADWCGACRKAKRHLARRGVAYQERNVDDPAVAAELLRKTGSRSIPVIDVGGRVLTGFSAGSYDALIGGA